MDNDSDNTQQIHDLVSLQNYLKSELTSTLNNVLLRLYEKFGAQNDYFNKHNIDTINNRVDWVINVNTVKVNKGDLSTNTLLKVFHLIFKEPIETQSNEDVLSLYTKFKSEFIKEFNSSYINELNTNLSKQTIVTHYELKNGYINIYLNEQYKHITNAFKLNSKQHKEISNTHFTVCHIHMYYINTYIV